MSPCKSLFLCSGYLGLFSHIKIHTVVKYMLIGNMFFLPPTKCLAATALCGQSAEAALSLGRLFTTLLQCYFKCWCRTCFHIKAKCCEMNSKLFIDSDCYDCPHEIKKAKPCPCLTTKYLPDFKLSAAFFCLDSKVGFDLTFGWKWTD